MFPIIRRYVAVVLTQTGAVFFWCHRLSLFLWHNIFVHLFEDLWIITHCELSHQDFVRMSSLMVHCEWNSPVTSGFPALKATNTDHWLFMFSVRSSVELSRPVVVHCRGHLPICPIWACSWAKNLSNLPQIGSRLCGSYTSETAGWIYPIESFMDLWRPVVVQRHSHLPICTIWARPWAKNLSNQAALWPEFAEPISLKPPDGFVPFEVLWNCLNL